MSLFTEMATIRDRTVTGQDAYGNDVYGNADREVPAWWEPRTSGEQTDARNQVTAGYWIFFDEGTELAATAQVHLGPDPGAASVPWYEVDGDPGEQPGGFIVDGYVAVALTRVSG